MSHPKPAPPATTPKQPSSSKVAPMSKPLLFNEGLLQLKRELSREKS